MARRPALRRRFAPLRRPALTRTGHSRERFDALALNLADRYLAASPPPPLLDFLHHSYQGLAVRHGWVYGTKFRLPKLVRME